MKRTSILLIAALILTNGYWAYLMLNSMGDSLSSEKYDELENYRNEKRLNAMTKACSSMVAGISKEEATKLLRELSDDQEPFEKEGRINTLWLSLKIDEQTGKISETEACKNNV